MHGGLPWYKANLVDSSTWARSAWTSDPGSTYRNGFEPILPNMNKTKSSNSSEIEIRSWVLINI
jgi:hypothetical protein